MPLPRSIVSRSSLHRASSLHGAAAAFALALLATSHAQASPSGVHTRAVLSRGDLLADPTAARLAAEAARVTGLTTSAQGPRRSLSLPTASGARELVTTSIDRVGDESIVHFAQTHRGLPVIGRGASIRLAKGTSPLGAVLDLEGDLPASVDPVVGPSAAAQVAALSAANRFRLRADARDAHLVVWPTRDRGARLAWAVVPRVPASLPTAPRVIVDAITGETLEARDTVVFASADAYQFNPVKTPTVGSYELALTPGSTLSNPFLEATNCVDNKSVRDVDAFGLAFKVHTCDLVQLATADGAGNFVYAPDDAPGSASGKKDPFSEVQIYYHASKAYAFFRQLANDPEAQVVRDKPLRVVANLQIPAGIGRFDLATAGDPEKPLEPFQNAFFAPAGGGLGALFQQLFGWEGGALWFGQGPQRDYAYDGDVVYHEFGHAVVDASLRLGAWHVDSRGAIDAPGAMNEGLADYFSSAITGDADVGEYASKDFAAQSSVIRTLDNEDKCPAAVVGEVHYDSTLFSGALWEARKGLAEADRPKFDAALYKAMKTHEGRGDLGYDDLTKLFQATLATDLPAGAAALESAMTRRGVLPSCERIVDAAPGTTVKSPAARLGFAAPGTATLGMTTLAPGILQVRAPLPKNPTIVTVTFTTKESGGQSTGLGGQSTPFAPVVLAKLGAPITWTPEAKKAHDADFSAKASGQADRTVTIDVTGATADTLYLQIANSGESDGAYDQIIVRTEAVPEPATPAPEMPAATTTTEAGGGCNVATTGNGRGSAAVSAALGLALVGAVVRRRRARTSRSTR